MSKRGNSNCCKHIKNTDECKLRQDALLHQISKNLNSASSMCGWGYDGKRIKKH